jgi:hypothetical protein
MNTVSVTATVKVNFETIMDANKFVSIWSKKTLKGHVVGSGTENVVVTLFDVTENELEWVKTILTPNIANDPDDDYQSSI